MKIYARFILLTVFTSMSTQLLAQTIIRGQILDANSKAPISYVNVYSEDNPNVGMISSKGGVFSIEVSNDTKRVGFSHISYENNFIGINDILNFKDTVLIYLQPINYLLKTIEVGTMDNGDELKRLIKKFHDAFRGKYAMSSCFMSNITKFKSKYLSFFDSAGFMFYSLKDNDREMIFLPYQTKASEMVYLENEDYDGLMHIEKYYTLPYLVEDIWNLERIGPLNPKQYKFYSFTNTTSNVDNTVVYEFKSNKKASFKCSGKFQIDFDGNIINWVQVDTIITKRQTKVYERMKQINSNFSNRVNTLELHFQHKDDQIHYKELCAKLSYWQFGGIDSLSSNLRIEFCNFLYNLNKPIYKKPPPQRISIISLYGSSLGRIYYDKHFWDSIENRNHINKEIRKDLEVYRPLEEQYQINNLRYAPEIDSKKFVWLESLFNMGEISHELYDDGEGHTTSNEYLFKFELTDKLIRPYILELYNNNNALWKK